MNNTALVRIHHADYQEDIPFWASWTRKQQPTLEIGCGHGRVLLPLLEMGREVVGVDIDLQSLESLREELKGKGVDIQKRARIIHEDINNFQTEDLFGAVIIPCNTYSTFPPRDRPLLLSRIYDLLTPGGVLVVSVPNPVQSKYLFDELRANPEQTDSDLETIFPHPETGYPVQVSSNLRAGKSRLGWDWIYDHLHPDGQVDRFIQTTEHYLSSVETYLQEFMNAGFTEISSMGDFEMSAYSEESPYLILAGKKPAIAQPDF
jgi:SAM-dependent methyltransferase